MNTVRQAVDVAVREIDRFLSGETLSRFPSPALRRAADALLHQSASVRTAGLFLTAYAVVEPEYDFTLVPRGWRGVNGDKLLCEELRDRHLALGNVKAFAENIGAKGAQSDFDPSVDGRFNPYAALAAHASAEERERALAYLASRYADSQHIPASLPAVGEDVLTFVRAKALLHRLLASPSDGMIQQFLVAALLRQMRAGTGIQITTHHPHGSDRSDRTAGDIEERVEGALLRAYEVTASAPWRDRLSSAKRKMDRHGLAKYVILASDVNRQPEWSEPARVALLLEPYGRDIAVVDLQDAIHWMAAQLSSLHLREALREVERMIHNPDLCGRHDIAELYAKIVGDWLDEAE